jgi:hypothetical protein
MLQGLQGQFRTDALPFVRNFIMNRMTILATGAMIQNASTLHATPGKKPGRGIYGQWQI